MTCFWTNKILQRKKKKGEEGEDSSSSALLIACYLTWSVITRQSSSTLSALTDNFPWSPTFPMSIESRHACGHNATSFHSSISASSQVAIMQVHGRTVTGHLLSAEGLDRTVSHGVIICCSLPPAPSSSFFL